MGDQHASVILFNVAKLSVKFFGKSRTQVEIECTALLYTELNTICL